MARRGVNANRCFGTVELDYSPLRKSGDGQIFKNDAIQFSLREFLRIIFVLAQKTTCLLDPLGAQIRLRVH